MNSRYQRMATGVMPHGIISHTSIIEPVEGSYHVSNFNGKDYIFFVTKEVLKTISTQEDLDRLMEDYIDTILSQTSFLVYFNRGTKKLKVVARSSR